jgi:hypothetical protein
LGEKRKENDSQQYYLHYIRADRGYNNMYWKLLKTCGVGLEAGKESNGRD